MDIINADFVRDFFQKQHKQLPELESNINRDNVVNIRRILLEMEMDYIQFKQQLVRTYREMGVW